MFALPNALSIGAVAGALGIWYWFYGEPNLVSIAVILAGWYIGDYLMPVAPMNLQSPSTASSGVIPFA